MRRSVRVFAVATFQEILIKCLFFNKKKHTCLIKMPYQLLIMSDSTDTNQTKQKWHCCEILMPVPVYSDCVVYLRNLVSKGSKQVSGHMQFSQTINLICRYTSPECTCLQADLPTDSSHKLYNRFSHDETKI